GLDEMLTVNRLGLPAKLRRSLACTNSIENMMGTVRRVCRNVKRWRNAAMALRWTAAGMMEAAKGFRRLKAYRHLPALRAALAAHQSPNELNTTLTPHSIIPGDACFAYFNKIWGIPATNTAPIERQAFIVRDTGKCFSRFRPPLWHCHLRPQLIEIVEDIGPVLPDKGQLRSSSPEELLACCRAPPRTRPLISFHIAWPLASGARTSPRHCGKRTTAPT